MLGDRPRLSLRIAGAQHDAADVPAENAKELGDRLRCYGLRLTALVFEEQLPLVASMPAEVHDRRCVPLQVLLKLGRADGPFVLEPERVAMSGGAESAPELAH